MTTEWKDLPTLQDVAAAQAAGEEIEMKYAADWKRWDGFQWSKNYFYRSRPVPKTRKVKMLAWFNEYDSICWYRDGKVISKAWQRVPSEDKEIEVMENE